MSSSATQISPPSSRIARNATLKDIAQAADVSVWLASSVLNNRHIERRIAPQTVEKVLKVASSLGYLPNVGARQLRANNSQERTIVLAIMTSAEAPLSLTNHCIRCLRKMSLARHGGSPIHVSLAIELYTAGQLSELRGLLTGDRYNAAIITNTTKADDSFLAAHRLPYPVVMVNRHIEGYACVMDPPTLGRSAAQVLFDAGSRRPALLMADLQTQSVARRAESFIRLVREFTGAAPAIIRSESFAVQHASDATRRFLAGGGRMDGLFCLTDGLAQGAYHAMKTAGLTIPGDVAVVGIGDYETSPFFDPPLTSIGVAPDVIGDAVSDLLRDQLDDASSPPRVLELPVVTQLRESTNRHPSSPALEPSSA